jgi:hypothetical protein
MAQLCGIDLIYYEAGIPHCGPIRALSLAKIHFIKYCSQEVAGL